MYTSKSSFSSSLSVLLLENLSDSSAYSCYSLDLLFNSSCYISLINPSNSLYDRELSE